MIIKIRNLDYISIVRGDNYDSNHTYCRLDEGNFSDGNCCEYCTCGCTFTIDDIYDDYWFLHEFNSVIFVESNNCYSDDEDYFYVCDKWEE